MAHNYKKYKTQQTSTGSMNGNFLGLGADCIASFVCHKYATF